MIIKYFHHIFLLFITAGIANAQVFNLPATGIKTHETMEVRKVEITPSSTVVYLSIENRREGGEFCADRSIYLSLADGTLLDIESATGIPRCPSSYKFKRIGEKLEFTLTFPPVKPGTKTIDLIENCSDYCFRIYAILLDNELSRKIEEVVAMSVRDETDSAIKEYKGLISSVKQGEEGIAGSLYSDLIVLLVQKSYASQAADYYKQLSKSSLPQKQLYLENLSARGIKF